MRNGYLPPLQRIHTDIHGYVDLQVEAIEAKAKDAVQSAGMPPTLNVQAVQGNLGKNWSQKFHQTKPESLRVFFRLQQLADAGGC